ncbi:hypothetical protein ACFFYR_38130 [Paraburkholderia dipogonis]|uniref:hypothetical protein n=1 Tax=Paraburkholderia dipogonis TaxID=1211383 RepID=UPI0035ECC408
MKTCSPSISAPRRGAGFCGASFEGFFTENVADLMRGEAERPAAQTRDALGQLACLGNIAEVIALTWVQGGSEETMHREPLGSRQNGARPFRVATAYEFAHAPRAGGRLCADVPRDERAAAHLRIGRALVSRTPPDALEDAIFDIVNHLNRGAALIATEPGARAGRLRLNLRRWSARDEFDVLCGRRRSYPVPMARRLLSPDAWTEALLQPFDLYLAFFGVRISGRDFCDADALVRHDCSRGRATNPRSCERFFSLCASSWYHARRKI